jgi:hypothetical protein
MEIQLLTPTSPFGALRHFDVRDPTGPLLGSQFMRPLGGEDLEAWPVHDNDGAAGHEHHCSVRHSNQVY